MRTGSAAPLPARIARQHRVLHGLEGGRIAEELGDAHQQLVEQPVDLVRLVAQPLDQVGSRRHALGLHAAADAAQQRRPLVVAEIMADAGAQQGADLGEPRGVHCQRARVVGRRCGLEQRALVGEQLRRHRLHRQQMVHQAGGHRAGGHAGHGLAIAGAWARTSPPCRLTSPRLREPSLPAPESTMQTAWWFWSAASEVKKLSIGQRLARGGAGLDTTSRPASIVMVEFAE